jgi:hypothetical protein
LSSGEVTLDNSGEVNVSQTSYDYTRPYWDQIGATIVGRHVFKMTDGWDGKPPGGIDHVVVVTHRPASATSGRSKHSTCWRNLRVIQGNRFLHLRYPVRR